MKILKKNVIIKEVNFCFSRQVNYLLLKAALVGLVTSNQGVNFMFRTAAGGSNPWSPVYDSPCMRTCEIFHFVYLSVQTRVMFFVSSLMSIKISTCLLNGSCFIS